MLRIRSICTDKANGRENAGFSGVKFESHKAHKDHIRFLRQWQNTAELQTFQIPKKSLRVSLGALKSYRCSVWKNSNTFWALAEPIKAEISSSDAFFTPETERNSASNRLAIFSPIP